eukprot:14913206-Alexandrium_andersonii.AAC.1
MRKFRDASPWRSSAFKIQRDPGPLGALAPSARRRSRAASLATSSRTCLRSARPTRPRTAPGSATATCPGTSS